MEEGTTRQTLRGWGMRAIRRLGMVALIGLAVTHVLGEFSVASPAIAGGTVGSPSRRRAMPRSAADVA